MVKKSLTQRTHSSAVIHPPFSRTLVAQLCPFQKSKLVAALFKYAHTVAVLQQKVMTHKEGMKQSVVEISCTE